MGFGCPKQIVGVGVTTAGGFGATVPAGTAGVVAPKPTPYITSVSPGCAGAAAEMRSSACPFRCASTYEPNGSSVGEAGLILTETVLLCWPPRTTVNVPSPSVASYGI